MMISFCKFPIGKLHFSHVSLTLSWLLFGNTHRQFWVRSVSILAHKSSMKEKPEWINYLSDFSI